MPEIETTIQRPFLAACPLCSHEQLAYQFRSAGTPIVRCEGCGLFMRNPQPSDVELAPNQVALASHARQGAVLDDVLHRTRDPLATLVDIWHALAPGDDLTITVPSLDRSSIRL